MEQKTFQVINTALCKYVYLPNEQKLMSVKPVRTTYDFEAGEAIQMFSLGGESATTMLSINSSFYASEDTFKNGVPLPAEQVTETLALVNLMKQLFYSRLVKEDEIGPYVWTYKNGEAAKWRLEEHAKSVFIDHNERKNNTADCQLPEAYESAEEVYMYNDYVVQNADGKRKVREGVYRRLFLTDEQNALLDKLQTAIDECVGAGITLDFDYATYELTAFNKQNIVRFGYSPECNSETEESYYLDVTRAGRTMRNIGDYNTEDSDVRFIVEKPKND